MQTFIALSRIKTALFYPIPLPVIGFSKRHKCGKNAYFIGFHIGNYQCLALIHNSGNDIEQKAEPEPMRSPEEIYALKERALRLLPEETLLSLKKSHEETIKMIEQILNPKNKQT